MPNWQTGVNLILQAPIKDRALWQVNCEKKIILKFSFIFDLTDFLFKWPK
jgi:hypothetical protein